MRILFVSNYYPPITHGGYEQLCREIALGLVERGHTVAVLTGRATGPARGPGSNEDGIAVFRLLNLEVEGTLLHSAIRLVWRRARLERENVAHIRQTLARFGPDAVMVWGMWNLSHTVPATLERLCPGRLAYYICDYWPTLPSAYLQQWQEPARRNVARLAKRVVGWPFIRRLEREQRPVLRFERTYYVSRATRDALVHAGLPLANGGVIHGNAKVEQFSCADTTRRFQSPVLRLLYCGRLAAAKGVHTAIRAIGQLPERYKSRVRLDIVGAGSPEYGHELRELVRRLRLQDRVSFMPGVPRAEIPAVLAEHDVLVFPSEWEEPFARIVLEAMAARLVVIGSSTGGTPEVLFEDRTGLLFPAGDAAALARQIVRLVDEPSTRERLANAGRQLVEEQFTFTQTADRIESALLSLPADATLDALSTR